jgi:hypothetical protein
MKEAIRIFMILSLSIALSNMGFGAQGEYAVKKVPYASYLKPGKLTVIASFDGGLALDRWQDILDFSDKNQIKFTFFVSSVYIIPDQDKNLYGLQLLRL